MLLPAKKGTNVALFIEVANFFYYFFVKKYEQGKNKGEYYPLKFC
jgi:hypothetical protein